MATSVSALARFVNPGVSRQDIAPASLRFKADFEVANEYDVNLTLQQQQGLFGVPRTIYVDNSTNPNTLTLSVQGTEFRTTLPAFAIGYFPISAKENDVLTFSSNGGATEKITIEIYNYVIPATVWYSTDPLAPGFDVQAVTPTATAILNRNTTLVGGVATNVFPSVATPRNCRFTNKFNQVVWYNVGNTATGSFAAGDKQLMPGQYLDMPYRTAQRISFYCAGNAPVEAEEWTIS